MLTTAASHPLAPTSMLPIPVASLLLPGESRCFDLDEGHSTGLSLHPSNLPRGTSLPWTLRELLDASGSQLVATILVTPNGNVVDVCPILQVTAMAVSFETQRPFVELTCIGRGHLRRDPYGRGLARIEPLLGETCDSSSGADDGATHCFEVRERFERCRYLAQKRPVHKWPARLRSKSAKLLLEQPLQKALDCRVSALDEALKCMDPNVGAAWRSAASEMSELELITYAVSGLSPEAKRLHALCITDATKRRLLAEKILSRFEHRMAADFALQRWWEELATDAEKNEM